MSDLEFTVVDKSGAFLDQLEKRSERRMRQIARRRVQIGKAVAPVGKTGRYKSALAMSIRKGPNFLTAEIGDKDYKAHWIEFGVRKGTAQRALGFKEFKRSFSGGRKSLLTAWAGVRAERVRMLKETNDARAMRVPGRHIVAMLMEGLGAELEAAIAQEANAIGDLC